MPRQARKKSESGIRPIRTQGDGSLVLKNSTQKNRPSVFGIVVNYYYDAYGNVSYTVGDYDDFEGTVNAVVMFAYNNLTYRGYYYDRDINMYYLQSRYYSPTWGRFINADDVEYLGVSGTALSYNLYAYCENDPKHKGTVLLC